MRVSIVIVAVLVLVACASPGRWTWRRSEGPPPEEKKLGADIADCEAHARASAIRGPHPATPGARLYGEPGNPDFDLCMHQRGWTSEYVSARR